MSINNILEISQSVKAGGRVPIKIALLKIHDDINETNKNGIHWNEEYVTNAIESVKMMPICCEFMDESKSTPLGHGLTGTIVNEDGIQEPVFENSETVGVIESAAIEVFNKDESNIKLLVGNGVLFNHRYPELVNWVRKNKAEGKVDTSIEIIGKPDNKNKIIYLEDKPTDEYRTPKEFLFSGTALLSINPADDDAIVIEIAQKQEKKEETSNMEFDMNEIKSVIQSTMTELNTKTEEFNTQISELNQQLADKNAAIEEKDAKIVELNASVEQLQAALKKMEEDHKTYWEEREILEKELAKAKVAEKLAELDAKLSEFNEDEKAVAKDDIDKLKNNINACEKKEELNNVSSEINSIKSKICMDIVDKQKKASNDAKIAEQNAAKPVIVEDIFAEMCSEVHIDEVKDINIF